jgi:hypothetical protein
LERSYLLRRRRADRDRFQCRRAQHQADSIEPEDALFAGSDGGAEHWAVAASLIESCKLNAIDPQAYLADVITKIVNGHPNSRIDELLPSACVINQPMKAVA